MKRYWVYILASHSRRLYVGVTNDLERRVREHRAGEGSAFTRRYHIHRLVYFEEHRDVRDAIHREKEIKGWTRAKKLALIESANPGWLDLAATSKGGAMKGSQAVIRAGMPP
jgi:putative endonuclease